MYWDSGKEDGSYDILVVETVVGLYRAFVRIVLGTSVLIASCWRAAKFPFAGGTPPTTPVAVLLDNLESLLAWAFVFVVPWARHVVKYCKQGVLELMALHLL